MAGGIAMNIAHKSEHVLNIAINRRNKLQQSFGKIGGNPFVGQRRPQCLRMAGSGQRAVGVNAQRFALKAAMNAL